MTPREAWWLFRVGRHLRRGRWQATPGQYRRFMAHYRGTGRTTRERMHR